MPQLRKREKALQAELASLESAVADQQAVFRLANNLESFLGQLRNAADTIDVKERQKLLQLIVKEIQVDDKNIIIKHLIPLLPSKNTKVSNNLSEIPGYLLRSGRHHPTLGNAAFAAGSQDQLQQSQHFVIVDPFGHFLRQNIMPNVVEIGLKI